MRSLRAARIVPSEFVVELDDEDDDGIVLDDDDEGTVLDDGEGEVLDVEEDGIVEVVVLVDELGLVVPELVLGVLGVLDVPVVPVVLVVPVALGMPGGVVAPCVFGEFGGTVLLESPVDVPVDEVDWATATPPINRHVAAMAALDFRKELM